MKTLILKVSPDSPESAPIAAAVELLVAGQVVAFPTETVYGLGGNGEDEAAVARIYEAKGRPRRNPLILHVLSPEAALPLVAAWNEEAEILAHNFWPGPLTLVMPRSERVGDWVTGGGPTVALRSPAHPVARALLEATGFPLAAPSANRSESLSPTLARHVERSLGGRIPLILDGGFCRRGLESTVIDLGPGGPRILRPGPIAAATIARLLGLPVATGIASDPVSAPEDTLAALPSPGLLSRHYAPRAPLELVPPGGERVVALAREGHRVGWLTAAAAPMPAGATGDVIMVTMPENAEDYASRLFAALHELDEAGVDVILVDRPPAEPGWAAVNDRLARAATP